MPIIGSKLGFQCGKLSCFALSHGITLSGNTARRLAFVRRTFQGKIDRHFRANPEMTAPYHGIVGLTHLTEGKLAIARDRFSAALKISPRDAHLHFLLGRTYWPDNAVATIAAYRRALEIEPNNFLANFYLGEVYCSKRLFTQAARYLNVAVRVSPENLPVRLMLGHVYMVKSLSSSDAASALQQAKTHLEAALKLEPHSLEAKLALAKYYCLNKEADNCLRYLREILAADRAHLGALYILVLVDSKACEEYMRKAGTRIPEAEKAFIRGLPQQISRHQFGAVLFSIALEEFAPNGWSSGSIWRELPTLSPVDNVAARSMKPTNGN